MTDQRPETGPAPESSSDTRWTVGEVAELAHVTVRTLHHYDEIGLLQPADRAANGYRLYSRDDLERLQQILLYRELGFALDAIERILDRPILDRRVALRAQRDLLVEKKERTQAVIRTLDRTLESMDGRVTMTTEEMFEGFEAFEDAPPDVKAHQAEHGAEARERWGNTDAYRESMRRAKDLTKADWKRIEEDAEAHEGRMASLLQEGADPRATEARAVAEEMRLHIERWFYPCDHEMHAGIADMYESDRRFAAHYDERVEGLASFVAGAIRANAMGR